MKQNNIYGFDFDELSEEDIIRGCLQSKIAVYLHGRSSEGKSARVTEIDPDAVILYLPNESFDSLFGKSAYLQPVYDETEYHKDIEIKNEETGEIEKVHVVEKKKKLIKDGHMIDVKPSWLVNLEEKCSREPDKIHVVFFDEITNAPLTIQNMVYNIILQREVNGKWKLPENARIAAAGNEIEDSLSANVMTQPLFNRFAHVYINTTLDKWLDWAKTPKKSYSKINYVGNVESETPIHPAIYTFLEATQEGNKNYLRTDYDGIKPNADPRKWEMASKILYNTNNPKMLRSLIGEGLTEQFCEYCNTEVVSIEDVINGAYTEADYQGTISQKYMTVLNLSSVDEENYRTVRNFVKKLDNTELTKLFDELWISGDKNRENIVDEVKSTSLNWVQR